MNNSKRKLKVLLRKFNINIFRQLPFGLHPFYDIERRKQGFQINVIFDVGANIGKSILTAREVFPKARIYPFEPFKDTYNTLVKNVTSKKVSCYQLALGSEDKNLQIKVDALSKKSCMNSLIHDNINDSSLENIKEETVEIQKLDTFYNIHKIRSIDYLKIDTEGFDMEVLKGAIEILTEKSVFFIQVEAGMNKFNDRHISFTEIDSFLKPVGYELFGFYNQAHEKSMKNLMLRRVDVVYVLRDRMN